jgi:hypothetical protein
MRSLVTSVVAALDLPSAGDSNSAAPSPPGAAVSSASASPPMSPLPADVSRALLAAEYFPRLLWVLRDSALQLPADLASHDAYLEQQLTFFHRSENKEAQHAFQLKALFPRRGCVALERPVHDEKQLRSIEKLSWDSPLITDNFRKQMVIQRLETMLDPICCPTSADLIECCCLSVYQTGLVDRVLGELDPKFVRHGGRAHVLTGFTFIPFVDHLLDSIQRKCPISFTSSWEAVARASTRQAGQDATAAYVATLYQQAGAQAQSMRAVSAEELERAVTDRLAHRLSEILPSTEAISSSNLEAAHRSAHTVAETLFQQNAIEGEAYDQTYTRFKVSHALSVELS